MKFNIIKIGGSVITDRAHENGFNEEAMGRLAQELRPHQKGSIVVHGTGLVGKPPAVEHGYVDDGIIGSDRSLLALTIKSQLRELNQRVVATLLSARVPALPFDVAHCFNQSMDDLGPGGVGEMLRRTLECGLVPVFYGDLMPRSDGRFQVFSSDTIVLILARTFRPDQVLFLSNVDGVYARRSSGEDGEEDQVLRQLTPESIEQVRESTSDGQDVSGGMPKKVACALEASHYCRRCLIASGLRPGVLSKLLAGESAPSTLVTARTT